MTIGGRALICCAGPSLVDVPYQQFDGAVVAVSTCIRYIQKPDFWVTVDPPWTSSVHAEFGRAAVQDPEVRLIIPDCRNNEKDLGPAAVNVEVWDYTDQPEQNREWIKKLGAGSVTYTIGWALHTFSQILIAGCDMSHGYCHDKWKREDRLWKQQLYHNRLTKYLNELFGREPIISVTPDSPINDFWQYVDVKEAPGFGGLDPRKVREDD